MFPFSLVPDDWALCFLSECPLKENCQRWLAYTYAPDSVSVRPSIMPQALKQEPCPYYTEPKPVHMACGFSDLFHSVKRADYPYMHSELTEYLGSRRAYYRYRSGERLLTPEQQSWIKKLFQKYGYDSGQIRFNGYVDVFSFPHAH